MQLQTWNCDTCQRLRAITPGACCSYHETSVSSRKDLERPHDVRGEIGPVPLMLCGHDPSRPVPAFDAEGRRADSDVLRVRREHVAAQLRQERELLRSDSRGRGHGGRRLQAARRVS